MTPVKFKFLTPFGTPIANQIFRVTLKKAAFAKLEDGFVHPDVIETLTDDQGEATLDLFPANQPYYVTMDVADEECSCCAKIRFRIAVPNAAGPLWADDLVVTDPLFSQAWDAEAIEVIMQAKAASAASASAAHTSEINAKNSEIAAAASAQGVSESAAEAAASALAAKNSENIVTAAETVVVAIGTQVAADAASALASKNSASASAATASQDAVSADASKNAAAVSATSAQQDAAQTASDRVQTTADAASTAADVVVTTGLRTETKGYRDEALAALGSITGVISDGGPVDLSSGTYPPKPTVSTVWRVTVAGVVGGTDYLPGDQLFYTRNEDFFYKLDGTENVHSVAGRKGDVVLAKTDVGLSNVDNTSDLNKPVSTATQAALTDLTNKVNATLKVAVLGDSLSQSSVRNNEWGKQTCELIQKLSGTPVQFRNLAINGANFSTALNNKEHENATKSQVEAAIEFAPDLVFIALGANDAVYSSLFTQAQVIANAQAVINALRAGIPNVKIIYAEELLHDPAAGIVPTALNNKDAVPVSHTTITLNGLSNARVNNSTYLNTVLSAPKLAAHQLWGNATTAIRAMADGWFSANIWKMARLGCMLDFYHVDQMGHTYWAWQAITYLSTSSINVPKVNFSRLKIQNLETNLTTSLDAAYTEALAKTPEGTAGAEYYGNSVYQRMNNWMMRSRYGRLVCESVIGSAVHDLSYTVEKVWPGAQIYYSMGASAFANSARLVAPDGSYTQTLYPGTNSTLTALLVAGTYPFYVAVVNPDGSADVFVQNIQVLNNYMPIGATALRYLSADVTLPINTSLYIPFSASDHDDIGMGSVGSAFTIPASLNGRKVRFRAGLRISVPLTSADVTNCWINAACWKNRTAPPGNSNAAGRGLPAQNMLISSAGSATVGIDLSLAGAAITVATGDTFEIVVNVLKVSTADSLIKAHSITWFEIEVVG